MKHRSKLLAAALLWILAAAAASILASCSTISFAFAEKDSWRSGPAPSGELSVALADPVVDKSTDAASIEAEIARVLPLLLSDAGIRLRPRGGSARYLLDVRAVEREYSSGWKTRRSTSVELWVREADGSAAFALRAPPLAASRVAYSGDESLSSSSHLYRLLAAGTRLLAGEMEAGLEPAP